MQRQQNKKIVVLQILILTFFCVRCFALDDEIGNPTVPPSSVKSGLVRTPNLLETSGNLTVTGNVRGGMQFRGLVPYGATTQFGAPLGSEDIGSFLRRSAPISSTRSQLLPQPYYLPSSTVGSIAPSGTGGVLTYPSIRDNKGTGEFVMPEISKVTKRTGIPAASPLYDYSRTRPLSYEPTDLDRMITYDLIREKNKKDLSNALQKASEGLRKSISEDKQAQQITQSTLSRAEPTEPIKRSFEPPEPLQPGQVPTAEAQKPAGKDVYEQMLDKVTKLAQPQEVSQPAQKQTAEQKQAEQPEEKEKGPSDLKSELAEIEKETAEAVIGVHKSFATQAKDKFNYYMRKAEEFLKQGKYYNAVDAYVLASIYKPDDPLAYAGRAHALFASGEYMSSAYFLARAINIFPQYVNFKIDMNAMIPDKGRLESRIADVKLWAQKAESAELSFLLAYIYYQLDKTDLALEAINFSAGKMPDNAAVKALKQAIEKKTQ